MMDRGFPAELNAEIVERAIRFRDRGVVAVDIGGPRPAGTGPPYPYTDLAPLVARARDAGLGVTLHAGEEGVNAHDPDPYIEEMRQVLALGVDRVGHGIIAAMKRGWCSRSARHPTCAPARCATRVRWRRSCSPSTRPASRS
jgi:adenosine deaminase